jgi:hypothetical protein
MILKPTMTAQEIAQAFQVEDPQRLANHCRQLGRRLIVVDGFSGVGKTTLAKNLSRALSAPLISLDDYLPDNADSILVQSYVERLDRQRLECAIAATDVAVLEGVLIQEAIVGIVPRAKVIAVYVALCSRPTADQIIWHDGFRIIDGDEIGADWFTKSETAYHQRVRPCEDADAIVLRVE